MIDRAPARYRFMSDQTRAALVMRRSQLVVSAEAKAKRGEPLSKEETVAVVTELARLRRARAKLRRALKREFEGLQGATGSAPKKALPSVFISQSAPPIPLLGSPPPCMFVADAPECGYIVTSAADASNLPWLRGDALARVHAAFMNGAACVLLHSDPELRSLPGHASPPRL